MTPIISTTVLIVGTFATVFGIAWLRGMFADEND